jgi:hypothetical protein
MVNPTKPEYERAGDRYSCEKWIGVAINSIWGVD